MGRPINHSGGDASSWIRRRATWRSSPKGRTCASCGLLMGLARRLCERGPYGRLIRSMRPGLIGLPSAYSKWERATGGVNCQHWLSCIGAQKRFSNVWKLTLAIFSFVVCFLGFLLFGILSSVSFRSRLLKLKTEMNLRILGCCYIYSNGIAAISGLMWPSNRS